MHIQPAELSCASSEESLILATHLDFRGHLEETRDSRFRRGTVCRAGETCDRAAADLMGAIYNTPTEASARIVELNRKTA